MKFDDRPEPAKRLEKARIARGFSTGIAACEYFGWKYPTYNHHENGLRGIVRAAGKYAKAFRVSEAWLLTGEGEAPEAPQIPLMGFAAGSLIGENIIHETALEYAHCPHGVKNVKNAYALRVRGHSMEPQYFENDIIFIQPNVVPKPGDTIIIQQQQMGEIHAFIKRYKGKTNGNLVTEQHNPKARVEYPLNSIIALHRVMTSNELLGI